MKKSDLKDGMVVELRKGTRFMLINDCFYNEMHEYNFTHYNEGLFHHQNVKTLDIVKVYTIDISNIKDMFKLLKLKDVLTDDFLKLIWERKEIDWSKVPVGTEVYVSNVKDELGDNPKQYFIRQNPDKTFDTICQDRFIQDDWKYCKLVEEPKEEITFDDINEDLELYCKKHVKDCHKLCRICSTRYISNNYNVTRK